jgi:hypothetical protein
LIDQEKKMIDERMHTGLTPETFKRLIDLNPPRQGEGGMVFSGAVRLSWPYLAAPQAPKAGNKGKPKYSGSFLLYHKNLGVLADAVKAAIKQHYPNVSDPKVFMDPKNKNAPFKDQGLKVSTAEGGLDPIGRTTAGYVPGCYFMTAKSVQPVPCFARRDGRTQVILPAEIESVFYPGAWVDVKLTLIKSTDNGNPGVFFGLQSVMKLADDTRFGGGSSGRAEDFDSATPIEDPNAIVGSTGTVAEADWDDEVPF